MAKIIDGKGLAEKMRGTVKTEAERFFKKYGRRPGLAVVVAGDDPASAVYVRNKIAACDACGIASFPRRFGANAAAGEIAAAIDELNADPATDGILIQLPLPARLDARALLARVRPDKDVDGFHPVNAGALFLGDCSLPACTPAGIMELLKSAGVPLAGKHAVIVGRSDTVGKPAALLLLAADCTVTVCHSRTPNLADFTRRADILVAAVGKKDLIRGDMVKPGAAIIDVGINRADGKLCGDVNFAECERVANFITPVPGGVGPMTVTMLLKNVLKAANARMGAQSPAN